MAIANPNAGLALCAWCRKWRKPSDLVTVERIATGVRRRLCIYGDCWRTGAGSAETNRVIRTPRFEEDPR